MSQGHPAGVPGMFLNFRCPFLSWKVLVVVPCRSPSQAEKSQEDKKRTNQEHSRKRSWKVLSWEPSGDRIARSCRHTAPDLTIKTEVTDRIAKKWLSQYVFGRSMFSVSGALSNHDWMSWNQAKQAQDRKTHFETLSLAVAEILSPVARQASTEGSPSWTKKNRSGQSEPKLGVAAPSGTTGLTGPQSQKSKSWMRKVGFLPSQERKSAQKCTKAHFCTKGTQNVRVCAPLGALSGIGGNPTPSFCCITLWHEMIVKITPWEICFVIIEEFCSLKNSGKNDFFKELCVK